LLSDPSDDSLKMSAVKIYRKSASTSVGFLDLSTLWKWMVSFRLRPPYRWRKSTWYLQKRRVGGPRSCLDVLEKRKILPLLENHFRS